MVKKDPEQLEVKVAESTTIDLITVGERLLASKVISYLDPLPVVTKMQSLMAAAAAPVHGEST